MVAPIGATPDPRIAAGALRYQRQNNLSTRPVNYGGVVMASAATAKIADAYQRMPHFDHGAVPAYRALRSEVGRQYDFLSKPESRGGLGIDVESTHEDPYGKQSVDHVVNEIRDDIHSHNRIKVLSTAATGGHPFFTNDENDMFRAVHDVFGHLGAGRGVDRHGEEAAFRKHAAMFSPLARQAMATETRGQNAALHRTGSFQDQKVGLLPSAMRRLQFMAAAATVADRRQAVEDNRKQGIGA